VRDEENLVTIRRPVEARDAALIGNQLAFLTTGKIDQVDTDAVIDQIVANEGNPGPLRRETWV